VRIEGHSETNSEGTNVKVNYRFRLRFSLVWTSECYVPLHILVRRANCGRRGEEGVFSDLRLIDWSRPLFSLTSPWIIAQNTILSRGISSSAFNKDFPWHYGEPERQGWSCICHWIYIVLGYYIFLNYIINNITPPPPPQSAIPPSRPPRLAHRSHIPSHFIL